MAMTRSFLPVGQGAFYCEKFDNEGTPINIVYDCGSSTNQTIVESEIKNNFEKGEEIQALFISHLHNDHINGIPFLLKHCKVQKIFFSLITSQDKELLKLQCDINGITGFTYNYINDPTDAINSLENLENRPSLIDIIDDSENNTTDDSNNAGEINLLETNTNRIKSNTKIDFRINNNAQQLQWLYIPHNFKEKKRCELLMNNLKNAFDEAITPDRLSQLWHEKNDNIKEIRNRIIKAYKDIPGDFNTNSMVLYSGNATRSSYFHCYCHSCHFSHHCRINHHCLDNKSGCLYTGDYDASGTQKWKSLDAAYSQYWDNIGCIQIPHHGSKHNFNDKFANKEANFIISAGISNKYRHPHAHVIKKLLLSNRCVHVVTESPCSEVYFRIHY